MCTIEKILIKGIRSFAPDNDFIVEFHKPLTIIVGSNGAGKTTIIECLRNATTGELPPNTRQGQSFVHDPKVAGESEVKAQIKLAFRTATGSPIYVTRSFQLTQKKTALQFKSLDAVLTARNRLTGQRESVTYRCADLDRMVPTLMGVSKAVLENVIFVHQDESNWPLGEPKVLKEKFDDIFAATKYTKALDALRKIRTDKAQSVKEYKLSLETLKQLRDMADHHGSERDAARARLAECQEKAATFESRIRDLETQRSSVAAQLSAVAAAGVDIPAKRGQLEQLRATNREREERLRLEDHGDFEESDEELAAHLAGADRAAEEKAARAGQLEGVLTKARRDRAAAEERLQRESVRHGQLSAEAAAHASNLQERDRAISAAATALGLSMPLDGVGAEAGGMSSAAAASFCEAISARIRQLEERVRGMREQARTQDASLSSAVDTATAAMARAVELVKLKKQQLGENEAAISSCGAQIQSSQVTEAAARALREDAERAEVYYQNKKSEEASSDLPRQLEAAREQLEGLGRRIAALRAERASAAAAAESTARLRLKRTDLESKQEQLSNTLSARRQDLTRALDLPTGAPLPPSHAVKAAAEAVVGRLRRDEGEHQQVAQNALRAAEAAKHHLSVRSAEVVKCRADVERLRWELRQGVAAALGVQMGEEDFADVGAEAGGSAGTWEEDYNNRIHQVEKREYERRDNLGKFNAMQMLFAGYRKQVEDGHECPMCHRPFNQQEREACLGHLDDDLKVLPTRIEKVTSSLKALQQQLAALRALQPTWVRLVDVARRLPELQREEQELRKEADTMEDKVAITQTYRAEATEKLNDAVRLLDAVVRPLDQLVGEVEGLRREVAALEGVSGFPGGGGAGRSVGEVDSELGAAEVAKEGAEANRDSAQQRLNRLRDEVLSAQRGAMAAQQRALAAAAAVNRVHELQNKIKELEAAGEVLRDELEAAHAGVGPLKEARDRALQAREEGRQRAGREVQEVEEQLRTAQVQQMAVRDRCRRVEVYETRGGAGALAAVAAAMEGLRREGEAAVAAVEATEQELTALREALAEDAKIRREVADVLEMRSARAAEAEAERELQDMEARLAQIGDPIALQRTATSLAEQRDALRSQLDVQRGLAVAAQQAAARAERELGDHKYADIRHRFLSQQVTLKTTEMAIVDLDTYHKALEKALLSFHRSKMADINKIIRELWQKTYRGQDIDYIGIAADTEGAGSRSYNYRVVMYSGSAELEMRGRCSAGQKVLACLIIRLALAETFCLNCGILALDEPTTNLDADNAASLARALRSLMESRSGQENFQLIVITHDEAFAQQIGTREYVDTLWRVTKDPATQHTLVTPEAVRD